jgi:hypothetical protein
MDPAVGGSTLRVGEGTTTARWPMAYLWLAVSAWSECFRLNL